MGSTEDCSAGGVFRPLAHFVVLALLPLRVPPPAVVLAATGTGLAAAAEIGRGNFVGAALLLQLKTVIDNADGQLARAAGPRLRLRALSRLRVRPARQRRALRRTRLRHRSVVARNRIGSSLSPSSSQSTSTSSGSPDARGERNARRAHRRRAAPRPCPRVYDLVYAPQDRLVQWLVETRLRRLAAGPAERLRYHDAATLTVVANFGLSTQLAALGVCPSQAARGAYLWIPIACGLAFVPLELRRRYLVRGMEGGLSLNDFRQATAWWPTCQSTRDRARGLGALPRPHRRDLRSARHGSRHARHARDTRSFPACNLRRDRGPTRATPSC